MLKRLAPLACVFFAIACSATPVPDPEGENLAVLGIRAWVDSQNRDSFGANANPAAGAYFVQVPQEGEPTLGGEVFETNYAAGATQYLFSAPPGRWALVAVFHRYEGREVHTYLTEASIRASVQDVTPNQIAYFGSFKFQTHLDTQKADKAQKRYFRLIDPKLYRAKILQRMIARTDAQFERSHKVEQDRADFDEDTRDLIEDTPWSRSLK